MIDADMPDERERSRLFRDECALCGEWAEFTGNFVDGSGGRRFGLFHCPTCRQDYRVWKKGLEEAWRQHQAQQEKFVDQLLQEAEACAGSESEQARCLAETARSKAEMSGDERAVASSLVLLGRIESSFSEFSKAVSHLREAELILRNSGAKSELGICLYLQAYCLVDEKDARHVEKLLREAESLLANSQDKKIAGACSLELARVLEQAGRGSEAIEQARTAIGYFDHADAISGCIAARRMCSRLLTDFGELSDTIQMLEEALALIVPVRYSRWARRVEAEIREELGDAWSRSGDRPRAEQFWSAARDSQIWLDQHSRPVERLNRKLGEASSPENGKPEDSQ